MKKFKLYFWNGFGKPELLVTSLTGILRDLRVSDNYLGDVTPDIRHTARDYKKGLISWSDLVEELEGYGLFMNPTYEQLANISLQWFDSVPTDLLKDFK